MEIKRIIESTIRRGGYDLPSILNRIDTYHIEGSLTDSEREELYALARQNPETVIDINSEIQALWSAVRELRDMLENITTGHESPSESDTEEQTVDPFHQPTGVHDAYFAGDVMLWTDGFVYECIAPKDYAVSWGPDVTPAFWQKKE